MLQNFVSGEKFKCTEETQCGFWCSFRTIQNKFSEPYLNTTKMKKLIIVLLLALPVLSFGQEPQIPDVVISSFNKIFPHAVIKSWTGNDQYNFMNDWSSDAYFDDYNFDGFSDDYSEYYPDYYYGGDDYYDDYIDGFDSTPYYYYDDNGLDSYYYVPDDYIPAFTVPSQYQLNFIYKGARMSGIFKPDGTFIVAKGRIVNIPGAIVEVVKKTFKGKIIRLAHAKEIMVTPKYMPSDPIYRMKVYVKHNGYSILKIDLKGDVISNNRH